MRHMLVLLLLSLLPMCTAAPVADGGGDGNLTADPVPCTVLCVQSGTCGDAGSGCVERSGTLACDNSEEPSLGGLCSSDKQPTAACCIATSDADCAASDACRSEGQCARAPFGRCQPANASDCAVSEVCINEGRCELCLNGYQNWCDVACP